ncbi:MAG: glycosyltransferase family 4 protein [Fusobacterium gastrosuis]|uniref:glycosyltransferase family 4 protein n=1 Tax=Fusobacterium gastrosuis TaxID=1755100 RepID=UPI002A85B6D6|nr:glycosyltransferase family 4 protein [Fusobacterium gastrosuis]
MSKLKILHLNSNYNTSIIYKNLFQNLEKEKISQIIYIPVKKNFSVFKENLKIEKDTFLTRHIFKKLYGNISGKLFFPKIYMMYKDLISQVRINEIDLVHAHSTFSNGMIAYFLKKTKKKKYIVAFRSTDYEVFNKFFLGKFIINKIMNEAEKIIFINYSYKKIVTRGNSKIERKSIVIPNGIEEEWIKNKKEQKKINFEKGVNFISIGYFIERKNFIYTIELIKKISKIYPKTKLTIIGEGPLEKKISDLIKTNKNMNILGWQSKKNLMKILGNHEIFILPSENETFGLVYLEALSQGLRIVYKKNDGVDGFLSDSFAYGALLDFEIDMKEIIRKFNNRVINENIEIENYSWKNIASTYFQLYKELIYFEKKRKI